MQKQLELMVNRGMVVDLDATNPEGWDEDIKPVLEDLQMLVIYEMHIRDFSIEDNQEYQLNIKVNIMVYGKQEQLIPGTDVKTGVDHLKELGINLVHILPTFDHRSIR